jgi:hypothetical protein
MLLMYMDNVITLSECSCGVQRVRRAISRKTLSWTTSVLIEYSGEIDRTGLKILGNNKNIQSITNILLRRLRLKFLRIMYSTLCCKERLNFENTLYFDVYQFRIRLKRKRHCSEIIRSIFLLFYFST